MGAMNGEAGGANKAKIEAGEQKSEAHENREGLIILSTSTDTHKYALGQ